MADVFYSVNRGQTKDDVQVTGATTGADVELRINAANIPESMDAQLAIDYIRQVLLERGWPVSPT